MRPLQGITVVAVEQAVAAPFATRQLADWGARVIKIERPGSGDFGRYYDQAVHGLASYFVWLNRAKESLALDLKAPAGSEILHRLLERADVLVENLAPGALARLGFSDQALRDRYPRLIVAHVSGYGRDGPYADRKAYDLLVQSEAGFLSVTGTPETPSKAGISIADIAAGMYTAMGVLLALGQRARAGTGQVVDVSMLDALGEWMTHAAYLAAYGGSAPARTGAHHATIVPYGVYPTGDGERVFIAVQTDAEWERFCREVIERPDLVSQDLAGHARRLQQRPRVDAAIVAAFARMDRTTLEARLTGARIAYAAYRDLTGFWHHPQLEARRRWWELEVRGGTVRAPFPPIDLSDAQPVAGSVPEVGQHTDQILGELGCDVGARRRLRVQGTTGPTDEGGAHERMHSH
ncbi:MAG: CaiB/BaiF CoA transferase family protein [Clostridia bacterium]